MASFNYGGGAVPPTRRSLAVIPMTWAIAASFIGLLVTFGLSGAGAAQEQPAKEAIHNLVRALAARQPVTTSSTPAVARWLEQNREAVQDVLPGPFPATEQYVSFYRGGRIYVHVLDWAGRDRLSLPSINDRLILNAHLLNGKPLKIGQAPWGIWGTVPASDRPDEIDTIVVLETEGDAGELVPPRSVSAGPLETILLQAENAKLGGRLRHNPGPDWIEGWTETSDTIGWRVRLAKRGRLRNGIDV